MKITRELTRDEEAALLNAIPKEPQVYELGGGYYFKCPWMSCNEDITRWHNYCPKCGQRIDWEGVNQWLM